MATAEREMHALRHAAAWSLADHLSCVRVGGPDAFEALDRVCPAELFLRDTQILATLLLDESARPAADLFVCRDDQEFILLADGMSGSELAEYIHGGAVAGLNFRVESLDRQQRILSVNGPYAWEVLGEVLGPEVIGLPYLSFFHLEEGICFRTGKTGEFGYDLLLPANRIEALIEQLQDLAAEFDLVEAGPEALEQCALENWFFNIRREGQVGVTPLELQLQWRLSYHKQFPGSDVLAELRRAGPTRRVTTLVSAEEISVGDSVFLDEQVIGSVVNAGYSPVRGDHVGLALLDRAYAVSGIGRYQVARNGQRVPVRTVSPPVINNRSLYVSPQLHSYRTREEDPFPSLLPEHARRR
jgi:aminomethyltransferase